MLMAHGATMDWRGGQSRRVGVQQSRAHPADWVLAIGPVVLVLIELVLLGANSGVLSAAAALVNVLALAALVFLSRRATRLLIGVLPFLALVVVATAWAFATGLTSAVPAATPLEVAKLLGTVALLLCGVLAGERRTRAKLLCGGLAALGGLYGLVSFWLYEADPFRVMGVVKVAHPWRFTGTLLNANVAGVVFGVIGLTAFGWLQSLFGRPRSGQAGPAFIALGLASVLISVTACGFTGSRMAFVTTIVLGAILCVAELAGARSSRDDERRPRLLALTAVTGLVILGAGLGAGKVLFRDEGAIDTFNGRLDALGRYTALAQQKLVTGWGPGAFDQVNQAHLKPSSAADLYAFGAAHSSALQILLEGGAPYLLLLTAAWALVLGRIALRWREVSDGWSHGLLAAVALAAVCSIDDIDLNVPAVAGLTALALGVLWGRALAAPTRTAEAAR